MKQCRFIHNVPVIFCFSVHLYLYLYGICLLFLKHIFTYAADRGSLSLLRSPVNDAAVNMPRNTVFRIQLDQPGLQHSRFKLFSQINSCILHAINQFTGRQKSL